MNIEVPWKSIKCQAEKHEFSFQFLWFREMLLSNKGVGLGGINDQI